MPRPNVSFLASASSIENWPEPSSAEVVVVGRSNVGKSSFINALFNQKKLAYVGKKPGKTQLLNFFTVGDLFTLVDVPGYGYAKLSKKQLAQIGKMMEDYFSKRDNIALVVSLIDARHGPTKNDLEMSEYLKANDLPILYLATKLDKVPKSKRDKLKKEYAGILGIDPSELLFISSEDGTGISEAYESIVSRLEE